MARGGGILKEKVADGEWTKLPCNFALARTRKLRKNRASSLVFIPNPLFPRPFRGVAKCLLGKTKSEIVFSTSDFLLSIYGHENETSISG